MISKDPLIKGRTQSKKRFKRPCKACDELFRPKSRSTTLCEKCYIIKRKKGSNNNQNKSNISYLQKMIGNLE